MNLGLLDVAIVALVLTVVLASGILTGRLVKSVSDFLAANRCAGRYLLCVAQGMAGLGAISMAAYFEQYYQAGFAVQWWGFMTTPVMLLISLSGWVIYRYRETRAMTLAQFFEMRYGRRFRVFSGIVIWVSGVLNYGIFPGVTARFLIAFGGLPATLELGPLTISTYPLTMALMLGLALVLALYGGQISVMISDFVQGLLTMVIMLAIIAVLLHQFSYSEIASTLINAPPGASPVNPFDQATDKIKDFNVFFFIMMVLINIYTYRAWQGGQGYSCSAKSAHEARMAGIIGEWRGQVITLSFLMIPICAWVLMHNSGFAADAAAVRSSLERFGDPQTANQMLVPTALARMLPAGLMGLFFSVIIMMAVSTDDTYLHSWGSILVQDVIAPLRKSEFNNASHLRILRCSIVGVAVFSFFFSLFFPLRDYIIMYLQLTGAIFTGGAGAVIIGGLYWRRGTTAGAFSAVIAGGVLALAGMVVKNFWSHFPMLAGRWPECPFNGVHVTFAAAALALLTYIAVSLLTCRKPFDLDQMLHRDPAVRAGRKRSWRERLGITDEFTRFDKFIYGFKFCWAMFWFLSFVTGTVYALFHRTTNEGWLKWWVFVVGVNIAMTLISIVWFSIGGIRDFLTMLKLLRSPVRDYADDGRVESSQPR